jgi:hypothetical protein
MTPLQNLESYLIVLLLGGLMGLLGQGSRAVAGLKSMADDAQSLAVSPNDLFQASRLVISLVIGFLVGLAAALSYLATGASPGDLGWHALIGFAASGYAGTDFLEAFISRYLVPSVQPSAKIATIAPAAIPALTASTPKQFVYSVIAQLRPGNQITDDTPLKNLAWDDYESLDVLRWELDRRMQGLNLAPGALANCTKVSDVTQSVTKAWPKAPPPRTPAKPAVPTS